MFDNLSKFLAQHYSQDFASWLIGRRIKFTELKPTELSLEPVRADSVILLKSRKIILHCEFQIDPDFKMGFRMTDYALRIYRKFPYHELIQVVVYLRETQSPEVCRTVWHHNNTTHQYRVIRIWEQSTAPFLKYPGLWAYAALTDTSDREGVLRDVAAKIETLEDQTQQSNLTAITAVISGLQLDKNLIQRILRRDIMKESVIYQEWEAENKERGKIEERKNIALKMIQEGATLDFIARVTGFSIDQIHDLQTIPH